MLNLNTNYSMMNINNRNNATAFKGKQEVAIAKKILNEVEFAPSKKPELNFDDISNAFKTAYEKLKTAFIEHGLVANELPSELNTSKTGMDMIAIKSTDNHPIGLISRGVKENTASISYHDVLDKRNLKVTLTDEKGALSITSLDEKI